MRGGGAQVALPAALGRRYAPAMADERIWTAGLLIIGDEILSGRI